MRTRSISAIAVLLAGCSTGSPTETPGFASSQVHQGIRYDVQTSVMESFPVQVRVDVTLTNTSASPAGVQFPDGCVVTLRAYRGAEQVWDQRTLILCTAALVEVDLPAGATRVFSTQADAAAILGDRLPNGRYRIEAVLNPDGQTLVLDGGEVDLAVAR